MVNTVMSATLVLLLSSSLLLSLNCLLVSGTFTANNINIHNIKGMEMVVSNNGQGLDLVYFNNTDYITSAPDKG